MPFGTHFYWVGNPHKMHREPKKGGAGTPKNASGTHLSSCKNNGRPTCVSAFRLNMQFFEEFMRIMIIAKMIDPMISTSLSSGPQFTCVLVCFAY